MTAHPDRTLNRQRLCELGQIERSRHLRWTNEEMLLAKGSYGELDLIRAVILDELTQRLKARITRIVWPQIEGQIDHPGQRLEVIFSHAMMRSEIVRDPAQLDERLPRNEAVTIIDLRPRVGKARERLAAFRARLDEANGRQRRSREEDAATVIQPNVDPG